MQFCSENAKDIDKYFRNTYVKFPAAAGDTLHYVDQVTADGIHGRCWKDGEEQPFLFHLVSVTNGPDRTPEVEYVLPIKSFFNYEGRAYHLSRIPARQYKKGICSDNVRIVHLRKSGEFSPVGLDFHILDAYVGKQSFLHLSLRDESYAISPRMAVNGTDLYIDRIKVGRVNYKDKIVWVYQELFLTEVSRVLDKQGYTVAVDGKPAPAKKLKPVTKQWAIDEEHNPVLMEDM